MHQPNKSLKFREKKLLSQALEVIAGQIETVARNNVLGEYLWAYDKAVEYVSKYKGDKDNFDISFEVLRQYDMARKSGIKLSSKGLGDLAGTSGHRAWRILRRVGEKPMYGRQRRLSRNEKARFERASKLDMTEQDIGYFLGLKDWKYFSNFLTDNNLREKRLLPEYYLSHIRKLNYRTASQIYEAIDLGFKKKEVLELLDVDGRTFDYSVFNKEKFSSKIIADLKAIYPGAIVEHPYIDFKH